MMTKTHKILGIFCAWFFLVLLVLNVTNYFSFGLFFGLLTVGFIGIAEFAGPLVARPGWRVRLNNIINIWIVFFLVYAVWNIVELLARGYKQG
jgi:hypothetical protein